MCEQAEGRGQGRGHEGVAVRRRAPHGMVRAVRPRTTTQLTTIQQTITTQDDAAFRGNIFFFSFRGFSPQVQVRVRVTGQGEQGPV